MSIPKASMLFSRTRQFLLRNKSTFQYEADKTFMQRWIANKTQKVQAAQKLYAADDSVPLWWKTPTDRALTTFVFSATIASFVITMTNLVKFSQGKL